MGIGLLHTFHHHQNLLCHSKSEFHIHAEQSGCDQLHLINHTLSYDVVKEFYFNPQIWFNKTPVSHSPGLVTTVLITESDRGPPIINV
jgi:hypothetical protein